jgi:hypothetical protein
MLAELVGEAAAQQRERARALPRGPIEQQAHGRTPDVDHPLSYQQMADDTAGLLRRLEIEDADVYGYSMGAGIAVELAIRHPDLIRKLALASLAYSREGFHPGIAEAIDEVTADDLAGSIFEQAYIKVAPEPARWAELVAKCNQLDREFEGWSDDEIRSIDRPTLVVIGDSDIVRPEHSVELFRLLGVDLRAAQPDLLLRRPLAPTPTWTGQRTATPDGVRQLRLPLPRVRALRPGAGGPSPKAIRPTTGSPTRSRSVALATDRRRCTADRRNHERGSGTEPRFDLSSNTRLVLCSHRFDEAGTGRCRDPRRKSRCSCSRPPAHFGST